MANVTSYSKGINGLMFDLPALPAAANPGPDDFSFSMSPNDPSTCPAWLAAPAPASVTLRRGAGAGGTDRVTVVWPDNAIRNTWLQVAILPSADTGMGAADVSYFGNLVGESGDVGSPLRVSSLDLASVRRAINTTAGIDKASDVNRDGRVNALDLSAVRSTINRSLSPLAGPTMILSGAAAQALVPGAAFATAAVTDPRPKVWDDDETE
jgi:hypothetical protein